MSLEFESKFYNHGKMKKKSFNKVKEASKS